MAELSARPVSGPWLRPLGERFSFPGIEEEKAALDRLLQRSYRLSSKQWVGYIWSHQVADGFAFYRVKSTRPLTLEHIPYGDGYRVPEAHVRGLRMSDLARDRRLRERGGP